MLHKEHMKLMSVVKISLQNTLGQKISMIQISYSKETKIQTKL